MRAKLIGGLSFIVFVVSAGNSLRAQVTEAPLVRRCTATKVLPGNPPPWASKGWEPPKVTMSINSCDHLDPGYSECSCKQVRASPVCPNGMPPWRCDQSDWIWR
jgi:hypothetical protein